MKSFKLASFAATAVLVPVAVLAVAGGQMLQIGQRAFGLASVHASASSSETVAAQKPAVTLSTAVADMNQAITANSGAGVEVAATLIDLDNNKEYDAGETGVVFRAASTTKVLAAIDYLHEVELGQATLTQTIDGVSAQQAIKQMIEVSDNDAWAGINDFLGTDQQAYAASLGLSSYDFDTNTITASDEAKLLAQLYQGKLLTTAHQALLYSYLANTDSTDLIPAALPANATVYNKYGELDGNLHDAAIVSYGGHHFVLVIYTKNDDDSVDDYDSRVTLIHAITTAAFTDIQAQ
jgi:beta-lactamase class A